LLLRRLLASCKSWLLHTPHSRCWINKLLRHKKRQRVVVGVFLPEEQCVKKEDLLPLAASSSSSLSCSSTCDGREQSSCSSQGSEFGGDLPVNEVTWPELAHQYLVAFIQGKKSGNPSGSRPEERKRFIRCLQRDGGVLFEAAATIVAVESDDVVLVWLICWMQYVYYHWIREWCRIELVQMLLWIPAACWIMKLLSWLQSPATCGGCKQRRSFFYFDWWSERPWDW